jgi:hypothetical protein
MNNNLYSPFGDCASLSEDSEIFIVPPNIDAKVNEASIVIDSTKNKTTHFYKLYGIQMPKNS